MSMPSDQLMSLVAGGQGTMGADEPEPGMGGDQGAAPAGAPMTTPQPNEGEQQEAMVGISLAMDLLEKSLPPFGAESNEGRSIMAALTGLSKVFGQQRDSSKELIPAELKVLMQKAGMQSPELAAMGAGGAPGAGAGGPPPGAMPMPA